MKRNVIAEMPRIHLMVTAWWKTRSQGKINTSQNVRSAHALLVTSWRLKKKKNLNVKWNITNKIQLKCREQSFQNRREGNNWR